MPTLNSTDDWAFWYNEVKRKAKQLRVWEYIDPETPREQLPSLPEPSDPPLLSEVYKGAKTYMDLNDRRQKVYEHEFGAWERQTRQIEQLHSAYCTVEDLIHSTVPVQHQHLLFEPETVYAKLRVLYEYFSTYSHEATVKMEQKWDYLGKTPQIDTVQDWLTDWDRYLVEARCAVPKNLQDRGRSDNTETMMAFLEAVSPLIPDFTESWKELIKKDDVSVHDIIQKFRVRIQLEWLEAEQGRGKFPQLY